MSLMNIIGMVSLLAVLLAGVVLKLYTRRKLKDLDGLGEISVQDENYQNVIKL